MRKNPAKCYKTKKIEVFSYFRRMFQEYASLCVDVYLQA